MTDPATIGRCCARCRHLDLFHDLNSKRQRITCSWQVGPQCTPCGCKRFEVAS